MNQQVTNSFSRARIVGVAVNTSGFEVTFSIWRNFKMLKQSKDGLISHVFN